MMTLFEILNKQGYVLIAEIGVNYYDIAVQKGISNMDAAKLMCKEALKAGVDAVKFQSYKAEKIASKYSPSYWDTKEEPTKSQYELFKKFDEFGEYEYRELAEYCNKIGIVFLSTPFDFEAADYLDDYMDYYKISSSDITNIPFIRYIAKKKKPILISSGAADREEIVQALSVIKEENSCPIVLMHCVLEYPTPYEHANLSQILSLKEAFPETIIGYSDHTKPNEGYDVVKTAYLLGAKVIEKHFTLDKTLIGNDHYHAMDPVDAANIKQQLEKLKIICGSGEITCLTSELQAKENARRSIVLTKKLKEGEVITKDAITFKRPGVGIPPCEYENIIGNYVTRDMEEDTILQWEHLLNDKRR